MAGHITPGRLWKDGDTVYAATFNQFLTEATIKNGVLTLEMFSEKLMEDLKEIALTSFFSLYKVGDYFITENDIDPAERFGGKWELIKSKFLIGAGSDEGDYLLGSEGGSKTSELKNVNLPPHWHFIANQNNGNLNSSYCRDHTQYLAQWGTRNDDGGFRYLLAGDDRGGNDVPPTRFKTSDAGGGDPNRKPDPVDIIPPYRAVYIWRKVADENE